MVEDLEEEDRHTAADPPPFRIRRFQRSRRAELPPNLGYTCCTCLMPAEVRVLGRGGWRRDSRVLTVTEPRG